MSTVEKDKLSVSIAWVQVLVTVGITLVASFVAQKINDSIIFERIDSQQKEIRSLQQQQEEIATQLRDINYNIIRLQTIIEIKLSSKNAPE